MYATSYLLTRQVSQDDLISAMSVLRMALTVLCSEKFENNKFCWIMKTTKVDIDLWITLLAVYTAIA